jgi:hypothetical protein
VDSVARGLVLLAAGAFLFACAAPYTSGPEGVYVAEGFAASGTPYGDALQRHTRKGELYQGVDTVAKAWATWRTPELRRAVAEASIRAYRLEGEEAETLRKEAQSPARPAREFHLALYTPKKQWNDLESPGTLWRLQLELPDGSRLEPVQVFFLAKTDKTLVEYPYVSPWTREYSILFPLLDGEDQGRGALVLTGPLGTMRFEW